MIVASAVLDVPGAFMRMATLVRDKKFVPRIQYLGINEKVVSIVWNERLKGSLSPDTVAEVERVEQGIRDGTVKVPRGF